MFVFKIFVDLVAAAAAATTDFTPLNRKTQNMFCDGNNVYSNMLYCTYNSFNRFKYLNDELNPIYHLLALLGVHLLHVSRISVKSLTLRLLMSYIYIYIYIWSTNS